MDYVAEPSGRGPHAAPSHCRGRAVGLADAVVRADHVTPLSHARDGIVCHRCKVLTRATSGPTTASADQPGVDGPRPPAGSGRRGSSRLPASPGAQAPPPTGLTEAWRDPRASGRLRGGGDPRRPGRHAPTPRWASAPSRRRLGRPRRSSTRRWREMSGRHLPSIACRSVDGWDFDLQTAGVERDRKQGRRPAPVGIDTAASPGRTMYRREAEASRLEAIMMSRATAASSSHVLSNRPAWSAPRGRDCPPQEALCPGRPAGQRHRRPALEPLRRSLCRDPEQHEPAPGALTTRPSDPAFPAKLRSALQAALLDRLNAAAAAAESPRPGHAIKQRIEWGGRLGLDHALPPRPLRGPGQQGFRPRRRPHGAAGRGRDVPRREPAAALKDLSSGKSLAQVAKSKQKSVSGLTTAMLELAQIPARQGRVGKDDHERPGAAGPSHLLARLSDMVNHGGHGPRFGGRPMGHPSFGPAAPATRDRRRSYALLISL